MRAGSLAWKIVALASWQIGAGNGEADGLDDDIAHFRRPAEPNFLLGRMHIHIHQIGRQVHMQEKRRVTPAWHDIAVGALNGEIDYRRARRPAIDENHLQFAIHAAARRHPRVSADLHHPVSETDGAQVSGDLRAVQVADPVEQAFGCRQPIDILVVGAQDEFDADVRQRLQQECLPDMRELRRRRAQKLAARRHIEEEIAHGDVGAARSARIAHILDFPAENQNFCARHRFGPVGDHRELRNGRDSRERLAPETHRGDGVEILQCAQFARGMPFDGKQCVVAIHPGAVVADANQTATAIDHLHLDARRAGVDGVFNELFEDGRRAFHDLSRGDLIDHRVGQHANGGGSVHGPWF